MKSDSVFELVDSGLPMLLVNSAAQILLGNFPAIKFFGASLEKEIVPLTKFWPAENPMPLEKFLTELPQTGSLAQMKFRGQDGSVSIFSVSVCPFKSGEEKYFIFQLFPELPPEPKLPEPPQMPEPKPVEPLQPKLPELVDSHLPSFLLNSAAEIISANSAATALFGAPPEKETVSLSRFWPAENDLTAEKFLAGLENSAARMTPLKIRGQDESIRNFSVSICPFRNGETTYFIFQLFPEILPEPKAIERAEPEPVEPKSTEPKPSEPLEPKLSEQKNPMSDASLAQKQKLDCALQLARTVSLDFNNALTSILGHTSLLLSKAEAEHPWRRSLMEVEKSASRAAEIAAELAIFSQQEKEARVIPVGNLNTVVNRCVEFFRNKKTGAMEWKLRLERELFVSRFNEAKVQQALTKVLENAVEAVNGNAEIVVRSQNIELAEASQDRNVRLAAGVYVCVEISDNGSGIPSDVLPRVFEPFFTTKKGNHRGLGLALVYGIVTNHGGGVAISSQSGAGTSVRVYLPAEKRFVHERGGDDKNLRGTQTILVVDDESLLLTMAETILTDYGYRVLTATSGQEAIQIFSAEDAKVDLVITDLVMPGVSGRELVEHIKRIAPGTPVFCTSGCVLPEEQKTGLYLQKPFTSEGLLIKVKEALGSID